MATITKIDLLKAQKNVAQNQLTSIDLKAAVDKAAVELRIADLDSQIKKFTPTPPAEPAQE